MKLEPHLPSLPSIGELLEHPRVKGLVARVNRSTLAQRAAGFLDELKGTLAARSGEGEAPSLAQLAERLARRLLGEPRLDGAVINATGVVVGNREVAPPLAERCLHAMFQHAAEYHRRDAAQRPTASRPLGEALGGEAACLVSNFEAALTLAIAGAAGGRSFALFGASAGSANEPIDWGRLAATSGAVMRSADSAEPTAALIRSPEAGDAAEYEISALAQLAAQRRACVIDVAPAAGTLDPAIHGFDAVTTVADRLAAGADLVIADGAGLVGGPGCGVIVGKRKFVEAVAAHPLALMAAIDPLTRAAMETTLDLYREADAGPVLLLVPVWQLLSTPLDNLRQRAERLAPLMGNSAAVASAESRQIESPWRRWGSREWTAATWAVVLHPAQGSTCRALHAQLQRGPQPVLSREEDGAVWLDLRTVFPRWDQQLVAAVAGSSAPPMA